MNPAPPVTSTRFIFGAKPTDTMASRAEVVAGIGARRAVRRGPPAARAIERPHGGPDRDRWRRRAGGRPLAARRALPPGGASQPVRPTVDPRAVHVRLPGRVGAAAGAPLV